MPRILVVDDDELMRSRLQDLLKQIENLSVDAACDQASALKLMAANSYQLALVDIELGPSTKDKYAGLGLLQDLSNRGCTTLVVSGTAEDNLKGVSFTLHAYDFIAKPINEQEFINKVQHALNWSDPNQKQAEMGAWPDGLAQDPATKTGLTWKEQRVRLSLTELSIVRCLIDEPNRVVGHNALTKAMKSAYSHSALATHISNIRGKFRDVDATFDRIHTEPGKGYYWKSGS